VKTWEKEKEVGQVKIQACVRERVVIITLLKTKVGNMGIYPSPLFYHARAWK